VSLGTTLTRDRELAFSLYPSDGGSSLARDTAGVEAQFRVYEGVGHTPRPAKEDIVEFHRRSIEGDDVSEFGQRLGIHTFFERTPIRPAAGEPVEFDEPGEYTVELTIVDSSGQSDDAWFEVVVGESDALVREFGAAVRGRVRGFAHCYITILCRLPLNHFGYVCRWRRMKRRWRGTGWSG
jgi:hypothetical protein